MLRPMRLWPATLSKELEKLAGELQSLRSPDAAEKEGERGGEDGDEEEKRERVRRELEKLAKEQAERRETAELMFELGTKAYGKGMYARAIEFLEAALTIIPRFTLLGGENKEDLGGAFDMIAVKKLQFEHFVLQKCQLREGESCKICNWADSGVDAYSAASLRVSPFAVAGMRVVNGFLGIHVNIHLAHTVKNEEVA